MSADEIRGGAVCKKKIELNSTDAASRAAAIAEYVGKEVLMCGGRNRDSQVNEVIIFGYCWSVYYLFQGVTGNCIRNDMLCL